MGRHIYLLGMRQGETGVVAESKGEDDLAPTPTPTIMINLEAYKIKILNGSKIKGEAGRLEESLVAKGFTVESIGNADSSEYEKTGLSAGGEVDKAYVEKLIEALKEKYVIEDDIKQDASVGEGVVMIVIGGRRVE